MKNQITLDDGRRYRLHSDSRQWILTEIKTIKEGENAGQEKDGSSRYFSKFEHLCEHLFNLNAGGLNNTTLDEMSKCFHSTRQLLKTAGWTKEDFK